MRFVVFWLGLVSVVCGGELRVLAYNIHHGQGMDGKLDLKRIAGVIRREKPDLVALQEVDVNVARSGKVNQAKVLAEKLGMHFAFGKTIGLGGGEYGNAVLSKFPIEKVTVHKLPGPGEARVVLQVDVRVDGKPVSFASTHFDHRSGETRLLQAKEMQRVLGGIKHPVIVAGDFNARPGSATMKLIGESWNVVPKTGSALTYPAPQPRVEIDYLITRHVPARTTRCKVVDEKVASDHRPVSGVVFIP